MSRPYWWFQGASVAELRDRLDKAGLDARLEVHLDGTEMTFRVREGDVQAAGGGGPPVNDSHICPPDCP